MDISSVLKMFQRLMGANLKPPFNVENDSAVMNAAKSFMNEYPGLDEQTMEELGKRLSHSRYWPTFFDIDEVLRDIRRVQAPKGMAIDIMKEARKRGPIMPKDAEEYQRFIEQTADRWFPHADSSFKNGIIEGCKTALFSQGMYDRICACCINGTVNGETCKNYGHKHFLHVVRDSVVPIVYCNMNVDKCEKYPVKN